VCRPVHFFVIASLTLRRFFKHYHPMLPILDPSWDPDSFYKMSPFVFWCLLVTGSRRYELDPTILTRVSPSVKQLALKAQSQVTSYFATICGLLILCTWPLPMNTTWEDPSPMYSGAAMQLALQHGLHMCAKQHASARPTTSRNIHQEAFLARVWAYLEFVCHW
jgi:transcriptional regulatory protein LEU3